MAAARMVVGDTACRQHDGIRRGALGFGVIGVEIGAIELAVLDLVDDPMHHGDCLDRILSSRRFGGQHDGVGPVINGGGDIRGLGAGGGRG